MLYARSIKDNITYGCDEPWTMDQVKQAAVQANAHTFINEMKDQYEAEAGEKGAQLSGTLYLYCLLLFCFAFTYVTEQNFSFTRHSLHLH